MFLNRYYGPVVSWYYGLYQRIYSLPELGEYFSIHAESVEISSVVENDLLGSKSVNVHWYNLRFRTYGTVRTSIYKFYPHRVPKGTVNEMSLFVPP